jgi:hypothetical protein
MSETRLRLLFALLAALAWPVLPPAWAQGTLNVLPPPPQEVLVSVPPAGVPPPPPPAVAVFAPGTVHTAAALNLALATPTVVGGSINNAAVGATIPQSGRFTTLRADGQISQPTGAAIFAGSGTFQVGDALQVKRVIFSSLFSPVGGVLQPSWLSQGVAFGTVTSTAQNTVFRAFNINGDTVNAAGAFGGGATANYFGHTISAGAVGGRTTVAVLLNQEGATTLPSGTNQFYTALAGFARAAASAGGTAMVPKGNLFGSNVGAFLRPGAGEHWAQVVALEVNVGMAAGTRAVDKVGLQIVQGPGGGDDVQAPGADAAVVIAANSNWQVAGWRHGILFGVGHGVWPMAPNGTLIGTGEQNGSLTQRYQMTTTHGIDFATIPVVFTGRAIATPGFSVDGTGQLRVGSNTVGWSGAGLVIGAQGRVAALSAIAGAGAGYVVGDILRDPYGGVWVVASVGGTGNITGLTMHTAPTIASGAAPSNPVALGGTGGRGGAASVNLSWAVADAATLNGRLVVNNDMSVSGEVAAFNFNATDGLYVLDTQVVGPQRPGWAAATGTATRTSFATGSVTTAQLAERVKALIDDLITHGLIGP